jgi:TusA-related sulfurtransferase
MAPADLNAKGAELSGGKDVEVWFNDPLVMEQIVDWLKGQATE